MAQPHRLTVAAHSSDHGQYGARQFRVTLNRNGIDRIKFMCVEEGDELEATQLFSLGKTLIVKLCVDYNLRQLTPRRKTTSNSGAGSAPTPRTGTAQHVLRYGEEKGQKICSRKCAASSESPRSPERKPTRGEKRQSTHTVTCRRD